MTGEIESEALALARGFLLGDEGSFSPGMKQLFRQAGITHLTAASGANLGLVAWLTAPWTRLWPRLAADIWLGLAYWQYWRLTGGSGSLWRATIFAAGFLLARGLGRRFSWQYGLGLTIILTWLAGNYFRSIGYWLSLLAVAGLYFSRGTQSGEKHSCLLTQPQRLLRRIFTPLKHSILIFSAVAPILWFSFGNLSPFGVLITPLVSWLVFPYQLTALLLFGSQVLLKPLAPLLTDCLTWEYAIFIGLIRHSARALSAIPSAFYSVGFILAIFPLSFRVWRQRQSVGRNKAWPNL